MMSGTSAGLLFLKLLVQFPSPALQFTVKPLSLIIVQTFIKVFISLLVCDILLY